MMTAGTACEILLAEADGRAFGFATFSVNHPGAELQGQLTLKDLYLRAEGRGQGLGPKIIQELARIALARDCARVDWTSETTNPRALAFYDRIGARRERGDRLLPPGRGGLGGDGGARRSQQVRLERLSQNGYLVTAASR